MEGPTLVILKESAQMFIGKPIVAAGGSSRIDWDRITGQKITRLQTWGKHFLIVLEDASIRIHYLMFGNYYLNSRHPEKSPKMALEFENGEWNNYNCAAKLLETRDLDALYDWSTDVMQDAWDAGAAERKLKANPHWLVSDALLDQSVFSGVGNIIKNEVLYRIRVHPESTVGALPQPQLADLIREARDYSFDFYHWKKENTLRQHWLAHTKKQCTRCDLPLVKQHTGVNPRRSFFCPNCQVLYTGT